MSCAACGREIEHGERVAHEVVGWERERDQGGTNHLLFRRRSGRVMCSRCTLVKQSTGNAQQQALL